MVFTDKFFKLYGQKWGESQTPGLEGGLVTYSFATQNRAGQFGTFDSFMADISFQDEITEGFAAWEDVANIRFSLVPDAEDVDVRVGWRDIDGTNGVLGVTTVPSVGPLASVEIVFDSGEDWFVSGDAPADKVDFSYVATHEIGHAIGIDHSDSPGTLMAEEYSSTVLTLKQDDIYAGQAIYGENNVPKIDINRFYNPTSGGHFFTADDTERDVVSTSDDFRTEGIGFDAMPRTATEITGSVPVYRFFNSKLGSHFFTSFEEERVVVQTFEDYNFEGIGFRAFETDSATTDPVHRFFNLETGGHLFTVFNVEKDALLNFEQFRYEGEAFYAFSDLGV